MDKDKEQTNDSLKNSDKNFNENFTYDKNQIIIHGECVPVITLTRRQLEEDWYTLHQQLIRKTQECEALKSERFTFESFITEQEEELQFAEQLIAGIFKTLNLEAYDWRADQNEILTEIRTLKQECEELIKNNWKKALYEAWYRAKHNDIRDLLGRYREALEEIEAAIATYSSKHQYSIANDLYNQILDIINKAKGEE